MNCWKCGNLLQHVDRKIAFRAVCDRCDSYLHCCKNCNHYAPGRSNDCLIPGTDFIAEKEANNFCEDFEILVRLPKSPLIIEKKSFDDLFK